MENIDRFFETYDRLVPGWFTDVLVTAIIVIPILLFFA
jgi:hypothetical protein